LKSKKIYILPIIITLPIFSDIDIQKNIYDSADEVIRMDEKMNRAIAQHNNYTPLEDEKMRQNTLLVEDFEEKENSYILKREIDPTKNPKIDIKIKNSQLTITTTTKEQTKTQNGYITAIKSSESSICIPYNADIKSMKKEYKDGILKITFKKKKNQKASTPKIFQQPIITKKTIKEIQKILKEKRFYTGEIDGIWDLESKEALREYQRANNLTVTKLSIETMHSLRIK